MSGCEGENPPTRNRRERVQRKRLKYASFLVLVSLFWVSCNEEPTSIGIGLLSSQDFVRVDTTTITAVSGTTIRKHINAGSSTNIMVGKFQGYEARALLRFTGIPDTLLSATVLSANLILKANYRFGDQQGNLAFSVNKMTQGWTETGVNWDSISTASYEPTARGFFSAAIADTDSVAISIDSSLVREWFQAAAAAQGTEGIILVPTAASNKIVGFNSFQSSDASKTPRLVVTFLKGTAQDTLWFASGEDVFVANIDNLNSDPSLVYVQAGVAYRSIVKFDLSSAPSHVGVHQAMLELTLNPLVSILSSTSRLNSQSVDSLVSFFLVTSDSVDNSTLILGHRLNPDSAVYSFAITSDVQRWISGKPNFGLQIEAWAETSKLDLFTFFLGSANSSLRPRLKIIYSRLL
jgi:hypothetical protein